MGYFDYKVGKVHSASAILLTSSITFDSTLYYQRENHFVPMPLREEPPVDQEKTQDKLCADQEKTQDKLCADQEKTQDKLCADQEKTQDKLCADQEKTQDKLCADQEKTQDKFFEINRARASPTFVAPNKFAAFGNGEDEEEEDEKEEDEKEEDEEEEDEKEEDEKEKDEKEEDEKEEDEKEEDEKEEDEKEEDEKEEDEKEEDEKEEDEKEEAGELLSNKDGLVQSVGVDPQFDEVENSVLHKGARRVRQRLRRRMGEALLSFDGEEKLKIVRTAPEDILAFLNHEIWNNKKIIEAIVKRRRVLVSFVVKNKKEEVAMKLRIADGYLVFVECDSVGVMMGIMSHASHMNLVELKGIGVRLNLKSQTDEIIDGLLGVHQWREKIGICYIAADDKLHVHEWLPFPTPSVSSSKEEMDSIIDSSSNDIKEKLTELATLVDDAYLIFPSLGYIPLNDINLSDQFLPIAQEYVGLISSPSSIDAVDEFCKQKVEVDGQQVPKFGIIVSLYMPVFQLSAVKTPSATGAMLKLLCSVSGKPSDFWEKIHNSPVLLASLNKVMSLFPSMSPHFFSVFQMLGEFYLYMKIVAEFNVNVKTTSLGIFDVFEIDGHLTKGTELVSKEALRVNLHNKEFSGASLQEIIEKYERASDTVRKRLVPFYTENSEGVIHDGHVIFTTISEDHLRHEEQSKWFRSSLYQIVNSFPCVKSISFMMQPGTVPLHFFQLLNLFRNYVDDVTLYKMESSEPIPVHRLINQASIGDMVVFEALAATRFYSFVAKEEGNRWLLQIGLQSSGKINYLTGEFLNLNCLTCGKRCVEKRYGIVGPQQLLHFRGAEFFNSKLFPQVDYSELFEGSNALVSPLLSPLSSLPSPLSPLLSPLSSLPSPLSPLLSPLSSLPSPLSPLPSPLSSSPLLSPLSSLSLSPLSSLPSPLSPLSPLPSPLSPLLSPLSSLPSPLSPLLSPLSSLPSPLSPLPSLLSSLPSPLSPLLSPLSPLPSPLSSLPSPLSPLPSPLSPLPSPLSSLPSPLSPLLSPLSSLPSPLSPLLSPLSSLPSPLSPLLSPLSLSPLPSPSLPSPLSPLLQYASIMCFCLGSSS